VNGRKYPREYLLGEIKRVARLVQAIPSMDDFRRDSTIAPETLVKRFGGWRKALECAGFDPAKARLTYHDSDLVTELKRVAERLGHTPASTEFDRLSDMSASTVSHRLGGSWAAACRAANLPPFKALTRPSVVAGWNKGHRKIKITADDLRYLYETEGLSAAAIGVRLGASDKTVLRMMREYGIPVKRLHYTQPRETAIEALMYAELERRQVPFRKQQVIDGLYYVDALVPGARIVIECDGEYWHSLPDATRRDPKKDAYLKSRGYRVFRFPEAAIHADVKACVDRIVEALVDTYK
jgi:very-short-patch-repair endonuclease